MPDPIRLGARWLSALPLCLLGAVASPALAESGPLLTLTSNFSASLDGPASGDWTTGQVGSLDLSARWGSSLAVEALVQAPFDQSPLTGDQVLHRLEISWILNDQLVATVGKQRVSWGSARILPSVDSLEPTYDPAHPSAVLDGVTGWRLEWLPNDWLSFTGLVLPAPRAQDSKMALRADLLVDEIDLSAGAVRSVEAGDQRIGFFGSAARFFDRFGLYAEAQVRDARSRHWTYLSRSLNSRADWTPQATVGAQIEVPVWLQGTWRTIVEYHGSAEGFSPSEAQSFGQALRAADAAGAGRSWIPTDLWSGGVGRYGQHYLTLATSGLPITTRLSLGATVIAGVDTGFFWARPALGWSLDDHLSLDLSEAEVVSWTGGPSEADLLPFRHEVVLHFQAAY